MVMLHPANRLSTHCITSMATLLLSCRSSQDGRGTLYTDVPGTDQPLVADTTSAYQTTLPATVTVIRTHGVATLTPFPQGIIHLVVPVDFMQEATGLLPLILRYSTRQPLKTSRKDCPLYPIFLCNRVTIYSVLWF